MSIVVGMETPMTDTDWTQAETLPAPASSPPPAPAFAGVWLFPGVPNALPVAHATLRAATALPPADPYAQINDGSDRVLACSSPSSAGWAYTDRGMTRLAIEVAP